MDTKHLILRFIKGINILLITGCFMACWEWYYTYQTYVKFYTKASLMLFLIYSILYITFGKTYEAFNVSTKSLTSVVVRQVLSFLLADGVIYLVICIMCKGLPNIMPGVLTICFQTLVSFIWTQCTIIYYFKVFPPQKTAIVYGKRAGVESLVNEYGLTRKYDIQLVKSTEECLKDINCLKDFKTVFLASIHSSDRNDILKYCVKNSISVLVMPNLGDTIMSSAKTEHMFHLPVLRVERYHAGFVYSILKRVTDIVLSSLVLIIFSPVMLITALCVKSDGGPAFYKQTRLTKDGKEFEIIKFRSMRIDSEKDGVARLASENDDRITPVGKVIRKYRIDELPQLINIIQGDMSLVGPRPERPSIAAEYEKEIPEFCLRLQVKAGLTGLAQVYGKYNTNPYDKLQMDLMYIAHPSIIEDVRIFLLTIMTLFTSDSTEGVESDKINAL